MDVSSVWGVPFYTLQWSLPNPTLPGPHPQRSLHVYLVPPRQRGQSWSVTQGQLFSPHQLPSPAIELHVSGLLALIFLKSDLNWYIAVLL